MGGWVHYVERASALVCSEGYVLGLDGSTQCYRASLFEFLEGSFGADATQGIAEQRLDDFRGASLWEAMKVKEMPGRFVSPASARLLSTELSKSEWRRFAAYCIKHLYISFVSRVSVRFSKIFLRSDHGRELRRILSFADERRGRLTSAENSRSHLQLLQL